VSVCCTLWAISPNHGLMDLPFRHHRAHRALFCTDSRTLYSLLGPVPAYRSKELGHAIFVLLTTRYCAKLARERCQKVKNWGC
jgi:hypothetical protein